MNNDSFFTAEDLAKVRLPKFAEGVVNKPFADIVGKTQKSQTPAAKSASTAPTPAPTPAPMSTPVSGGLTFDEAFTRLRMLLGTIPQKSRQAMLPILVERMSRRLSDPADREDFRTLGMSLLDTQQESDAFQKYMPILLILSMMRSG